MQKLLTFFSKNICLYAIFNDQSFNNMLTNNIVSFKQLGPVMFCITSQRYSQITGPQETRLGISMKHEQIMKLIVLKLCLLYALKINL